MRKITDCYLCK